VSVAAHPAGAPPWGAGRSLVRTLRKLPQYTRTPRHVRTVLTHSTPRRLANLVLIEAEYLLRRTRVRGRPYILFVDPTNVCNLRCPLCPTGIGQTGRRAQMMPWETFTRAIDALAPYAYEVNLHNWGESLLHKHVFDMIAYARDRNLATNMSENFGVMRAGDCDRLIDSGLEYLTLSIDGVTQDVYAHYRRGGDLTTVLANARELLRRRRERRSRTPFVEWQFIVMKHNAHEVGEARHLAADMGVDRFRVIPPGIPFDVPHPQALKAEWFVPSLHADAETPYEDFRGQRATACFYLYRSFTVNPDGKTAPCCIVNGERNDFGDILRDDVATIWNNPRYLAARGLFGRGSAAPHVRTVCDGCDPITKRRPPVA